MKYYKGLFPKEVYFDYPKSEFFPIRVPKNFKYLPVRETRWPHIFLGIWPSRNNFNFRPIKKLYSKMNEK